MLSKQKRFLFAGNERHFIHASRAIIKLEEKMRAVKQEYSVELYGSYPSGLTDMFPFSGIWVDSYSYEGIQSLDHSLYETVLHADVDYMPEDSDSPLSLSQWYERKLFLEVSNEPSPDIPVNGIASNIQLAYRKKNHRQCYGNVAFLMLPSPQDEEWESCISLGNFFRIIINSLYKNGISVSYPSVYISNGMKDLAYNHNYYYPSNEDKAILDYCWRRKIETVDQIAEELLSCMFYVGWDNWIADMARALSVPTCTFSFSDGGIFHSPSGRISIHQQITESTVADYVNKIRSCFGKLSESFSDIC